MNSGRPGTGRCVRVLISWSLDAFDAVSTLGGCSRRLRGVLLHAQLGSDETSYTTRVRACICGATHQVGVVVALIIDDCENLCLNTNRIDKILRIPPHSGCHGVSPTTENTIIEWSLKLVRSVASTNGGR